jgi:SpoVK/Ycf46/Vps4 family AAA+-type ATPase
LAYTTPVPSKKKKRWSAILFGPPGTAKTTLAEDIARSLGWPLVTIETSDFLAQGVDKMAHQARLLFRKLEQLREVVVFIDEVEEFVRERTEAEADRESRLTTTAMLTLLQRFLHNKRAILIFATNHSEVFDRAITRRFDLMVLVKPPNVDSKIALWRERRQNVPPTLLAKEEEALRSNADIVDRFTYDEWATFMEQHEELGRKAAASEGELAPLLRETAAALIIDKREWKRWAKSKSAVR